MATIITLPAIHGLDKEKCFPKGQERLWNYFSVDIYNVKHSKIFRPHLFMPTNEFNLSYQKMIPKFEFIRDIEPDLPCDPLCQEGWYFDCETETCKEYSSYKIYFTYSPFAVKYYEYSHPIVLGKAVIYTGNFYAVALYNSPLFMQGLSFSALQGELNYSTNNSANMFTDKPVSFTLNQLEGTLIKTFNSNVYIEHSYLQGINERYGIDIQLHGNPVIVLEVLLECEVSIYGVK